MTSRTLGIDLSPESIKLVELGQNGKISVIATEYLAAEEGETSPARILVSSLKKKKFNTSEAIVALATNELAYQLIDLPPLAESEVAAAINFKLGPLLPFPIEEAILNYHRIPVESAKNKQWYFAAAVPVKIINSIVGALRKVGLKPKDLIPASCALHNAAKIETPQAHALVYFGKQSTIIVLVKEGKTAFARDVKVGTEEIVRSLAGSLNTPGGKIEIDATKARETLDKFGIPLGIEEYTREAGLPGDAVMSLIRPVLEKIGLELTRTFQYYRDKTGDETEFKEAYFTGEAIWFNNFVEYFQGSLELTVAKLPLVLEKDDPGTHTLSRAIGAALSKKSRLSLLPERYKNPVKYFVSGLMNFYTLGVIFALLLALGWGGAYYRYTNLVQQKIIVQRELAAEGLADKGGEGMALAAVMQQLGHRTGATDRFILMMGRLHRLIPKGVYFKELAYDRKSGDLQISGVMLKSAGNQALTDFVEKLKQSPVFLSVDLQAVKESDEFVTPTYEFSIKTKINREL